MIEELPHPLGVVLLIGGPRQAVVLARILEQHHRLLQPAERVEVLDALREVDGAVLIVVQDDERRLHVLRVRDGRVPRVGRPLRPRPVGEPALAALEDRAVGAARVLVDHRIHADHVRQRRAGDRRGEDVGLRDRERRLVAAPRVAVQRRRASDRRRRSRSPPAPPAPAPTPPTCPDR